MHKKTVRVCHFHKLKILLNGDIYPCCRSPRYAKLGNIFDENIYEKIENTDVICECQMFKSVARTENDKINLDYIHYETSNVCQANCVCCPQPKNQLDNTDKLTAIKEYTKGISPELLGEEIVQKVVE